MIRNKMIQIPVSKLVSDQPQYKVDCLNGDAHPLEIESVSFVLKEIGNIHFYDAAHHKPFTSSANLSAGERQMVDDFCNNPQMQWAIANSFDGVYVDRITEVDGCNSSYKFYVYMKEEHITFWNLKFGVTNGKNNT